MCPLEHIFDNHEFCDEVWCEKKRGSGNIFCEIKYFDKGLVIDNTTPTNVHMNDPKENLDRSAAGYYRSKETDHEIYGILVNEFEKYVTDEKLSECCHLFDTNINESLNNIVAKYAPKTKHSSKSEELRIIIYVACCIFLIGDHGFWTEFHKN